MLWIRRFFIVALASCSAVSVHAADMLSLKVTPGTFYGRYDGSQYRDYFQGESIFIEAQSPHWRISAGSERSRIKYKFGLPDFEQNAGFLSGSVTYSTAHSPSAYTFRLDLHSVRDYDNTLSGDDVRVIAPMISYARLDNSIYLDLGYATSRYENSAFLPGSLQIQQWTPTLGFALISGANNWLSLRGYFIHSSNPLRSQRKTHTSAVEVKYLYYPRSPYKFIPQHIEVSALSGERIYAVDRDTTSVDNLAEVEKGKFSLGVQWLLIHSVKLFIVGNRSKFTEQTYNGYQEYFQQSVWLGLVTQW